MRLPSRRAVGSSVANLVGTRLARLTGSTRIETDRTVSKPCQPAADNYACCLLNVVELSTTLSVSDSSEGWFKSRWGHKKSQRVRVFCWPARLGDSSVFLPLCRRPDAGASVSQKHMAILTTARSAIGLL